MSDSFHPQRLSLMLAGIFGLIFTLVAWDLASDYAKGVDLLHVAIESLVLALSGSAMLWLVLRTVREQVRSIMCEALARHLGRGRIAAFSAGSQPSGSVHPDTLQQLESRGIATRGLRSQSWDTFAELAPDALITVCDSAVAYSERARI